MENLNSRKKIRGHFYVQLILLRNRLADSPGVEFRPGFCPETAATPPLRATRFHLDLDLYQSTLAGLEFSYPQLQPGGALVSHDYGDASEPGVKQALNDFLRGRPEHAKPLRLTQGLAIKLEHPAPLNPR